MEGNLRLKIDWASLTFGSKFTFFALFYFVFEGNFPSTSPQGGNLIEGFLHYRFGGAYIWRGLYKWRGLFSEFYCILINVQAEALRGGEGGGGVFGGKREVHLH